MSNKITHITITTHEADKKIGEIAFFDPLSLKNPKKKRAAANKSGVFVTHSLFHKGKERVKQIFFKNVKFFLSGSLGNEDRKLKTVVALFLSHETLKHTYLKEQEKREKFAQAVMNVAKELEVEIGELACDDEEELCKQLTTLRGAKKSLLEDKKALARNTHLLSQEEREHILFLLLAQLERIPLTSVVEVADGESSYTFSMTTHHGKTEISEIDALQHRIRCRKEEGLTKPSLNFCLHNLSDQHLLFDSSDKANSKLLCGHCGNLESDKKVLEQILFLLNYDPEESVWIKEEAIAAEELTLCFTSFYCWHELDLLISQKASIDNLNHKLLRFKTNEGYERTLRLKLLSYNIPLSNWVEPGETKATMQDLNDEALIDLLRLSYKKHGLTSEKLNEVGMILDERYRIEMEDEDALFLRRKKLTLDAIDTFRSCKKEIFGQLREKEERLVELSQNKLIGIEQLLNINNVLRGLNILHNHNSNRLPKLLASGALLKAQIGYEKMQGVCYLPLKADEHEQKLFSLLYSIYLVLEEPRLHAALSGGYLNEARFYEEIRKNKQLSHYLSPLFTHFTSHAE